VRRRSSVVADGFVEPLCAINDELHRSGPDVAQGRGTQADPTLAPVMIAAAEGEAVAG